MALWKVTSTGIDVNLFLDLILWGDVEVVRKVCSSDMKVLNPTEKMHNSRKKDIKIR